MDEIREQGAIEICQAWFNHLDRQQEKAVKMQRLAAKARKGPKEAKEAQRELRQMDRQPKVYDGARLRPAVERLLAVAEAADIYRKHMTGEIKPVQACGMDLDDALTALKGE